MHGDNRKNIQDGLIDYSYISLMSNKIKIGVIGGGKAGEIKTKHFVKNKCSVYVLAKEFSKEIIQFRDENKEYLNLVCSEFEFEFLKDKHLIIIALNDEITCSKIRKYCDENYKIYIDSSDFTKGMGVVPVERSTENMNFALNTRGGNPKGAVFACNKAQKELIKYDKFIEITTRLRNNAKSLTEYKNDIFKIIYSEEFFEATQNNTYIDYLKTRLPKQIIDILLKD